MSIDELLRSSSRREHAAMPESDALTEVDGLQEADLVDARFLAGECRERSCSISVLRCSSGWRTRRCWCYGRWQRSTGRALSRGGRGRVAHYVMSSRPDSKAGRFALEMVCLRGWRLSAIASSAEFFVGDVPGLPEAPPSFIEDDESTIVSGMPSWASTFKPGWATFLDLNRPSAPVAIRSALPDCTAALIVSWRVCGLGGG